jgi:hypothetical protein
MANEQKTKPAKPAPPAKKAPKELPTLNESGQKQLTAIQSQATALINEVTASGDVGVPHLRRFFQQFATQFRTSLKTRKGDVQARKKARLEAKLAKIQAEIAKLGPASGASK